MAQRAKDLISSRPTWFAFKHARRLSTLSESLKKEYKLNELCQRPEWRGRGRGRWAGEQDCVPVPYNAEDDLIVELWVVFAII